MRWILIMVLLFTAACAGTKRPDLTITKAELSNVSSFALGPYTHKGELYLEIDNIEEPVPGL